MPTKGKRKGKSAWNIKSQGSGVVGWACPETVGLYNIDFNGKGIRQLSSRPESGGVEGRGCHLDIFYFPE